jgi:hypothetical protein
MLWPRDLAIYALRLQGDDAIEVFPWCEFSLIVRAQGTNNSSNHEPRLMQLTEHFSHTAPLDHFHARSIASKIGNFFDRTLAPVRRGIREHPIKFMALVAWVAFFFGLVAKGLAIEGL